MVDAKDKTRDDAQGEAGEGASEREAEAVIVLVDNLGPNLLKKGDITTDPEIVALKGDRRGFVSELKGR